VFGLVEIETLTEALQRVRSLVGTFTEQEAITTSLARKRNIAGAINELETLSVKLVATRAMAFGLTETEAQSAALARTRKVSLQIVENEANLVVLGRNRRVGLAITENETISAVLGRVRGLVAQVAEHEAFTATTFTRLRNVLIGIHETTGFGFDVSVDHKSRSIKGTMSWQAWVAVEGGGQMLQTMSESFEVMIEPGVVIPVVFDGQITVPVKFESD
jgi:hypothetical protein